MEKNIYTHTHTQYSTAAIGTHTIASVFGRRVPVARPSERERIKLFVVAL